MPEEVNRLLTDQLSDLLFTPSEDGNDNLKREGIDPAKVHLVGNVMIDTLIRMLPKAVERLPQHLPKDYALVTLHRPSNVDDMDWLKSLLKVLEDISRELPVLFPVHPRTRQRLVEWEFVQAGTIRLCSYSSRLPTLSFWTAESGTRGHHRLGGIQEETTFLGVPCLTVRENTERPITVSVEPMFWLVATRNKYARKWSVYWRGEQSRGRSRRCGTATPLIESRR